MITWKLLAIAFGSATVGLATIVMWQLVERAQTRKRYAGIRDVEREIARRRHQLHIETSTREHVAARELAGKRRVMEEQLAAYAEQLEQARCELADARLEAKVLAGEHAAARDSHEKLCAELAELEDSAASFTSGLYAPVVPPGASDETVQRLVALREQQRELAHTDRAITCWTPWVDGDRRDGEQLQRHAARLLLRAFNAECDAAIAQVRWNNLTQMVVRITHAFGALNKLGAPLELELTPPYRALKLEELRLEHACRQGRNEPDLVDGTALPFGSAAGRGHAPAVDGTALPFGSAAGRGHAPAVDERTPIELRRGDDGVRVVRA